MGAVFNSYLGGKMENPYGSCFWCQRRGPNYFEDIDGNWRYGCDIHQERYQKRIKEEKNGS